MECDVIVIGGGHAGIEAAAATAKLGLNTVMVTLSIDAIGLMPCNPAIGGTAKGHLVREIDALGGMMGILADKSLLQIKMLNTAKGPAVFSLRGQADKAEYHKNVMAELLKEKDRLTVVEGEAEEILSDGEKVVGVVINGEKYAAKAVVLCTGVYLHGRIITGSHSISSGPSGFPPATKLTDSLINLGIDIRRFKTGTPARIYRDSIDYDKMEIQNGEDVSPFSFMTDGKIDNVEPCYLTYTNEETHRIIRENIGRSPLYNGDIKGVGPRYCPSIEDKVMRFKDKERHQIFVEPEGRNSEEMYIQGMSSSLPHDVQEKMYRTISGLENCRFAKYAYAIEYDCINPLELDSSLKVKRIKGLYSGGQINGSSGYEEAAAQGLIAGINAAMYVLNKEPFILHRDEAYIGVLIDDLVTKGTNEPYRMMTARAEHRIYLRQDNADVRLTKKSYNLGLASAERMERLKNKKEQMAKLDAVKDEQLPKEIREEIFRRLEEEHTGGATLFDVLKRPRFQSKWLKELGLFTDYDDRVIEALCVEKKYDGYLKKQEKAISEQKRLEDKVLPPDIDYSEIKGLRIEARQKLEKIRPQSLGQASRISGVSPADIAVLIVYLGGKK
ncbi:MAG: tRNA uridine-5-carboxymethylaminomethyl(34) synthesis enzyme MnmG [Christensenellales bacterium]